MNFLEAAAEAFKRCRYLPASKVNNAPNDYATYIHSEFWEDRKRRYWQTHQKRCVICLTWKYIDLHHLRYVDFGNESDNDLVPVCRTHHDLFHRGFGTKRDMRPQWRYFLTSFGQKVYKS